jgi:hypothetical protein
MQPVAGKNVIHPELSYEIMQVIFEVHNQLGPGFTEEVYFRTARGEYVRIAN